VPPAEPDLAIIGGGPGGYVAAIRAAQLGMRVTLVEREAIGGVCLNWGCIPTKSLLRSAEVLSLVRRASEFGVEVAGVQGSLDAAVARSREVVGRVVRGVEYLLEHHGVTVIRGTARLESPQSLVLDPTGARVRARHVIIATGARPYSPWPVDGVRVITSREALQLHEPPARVIVIGGGCVGVELAQVLATFNGTVTLVERRDSLLPDVDGRVTEVLRHALERQGVRVRTGTTVDHLAVAGGEVTASLSSVTGTERVVADRALVALGIVPNSSGLGLEEVGVQLDDRGFIATNALGETTLPGVYAIGDVTGRLPLAHVAFAQATTAVEAIAGRSPRPLDYGAIPRAVYTHPQVASVGLSEAQAVAEGRQVALGRFPFSANGGAAARAEPEGAVVLVTDADSGEVLGCHIVGDSAAELIHEVALGRTLETTVDEIIATVHAHPTLAEAIREAALATRDGAIHFVQARSR
jgi:dihydrolipoamide dehydrogenase